MSQDDLVKCMFCDEEFEGNRGTAEYEKHLKTKHSVMRADNKQAESICVGCRKLETIMCKNRCYECYLQYKGEKSGIQMALDICNGEAECWEEYTYKAALRSAISKLKSKLEELG